MKGQQIAEGASAEVLDWGADQALKLFKPEYEYAVAMEAERTRAVHAAGLPVPAVIDVIEERGRTGIVYERIDGPTLLEELRDHPERFQEITDEFARLHSELHGQRVETLPRALDLVEKSTAQLPEPERSAQLSRIAAAPVGDRVYHGDMHPGNVIRSARGLVVVDWVNALSAHPAVDVARSIALIRYQTAPGASDSPARRRARGALADAYLASYLALRSVTRAEVEASLPIHAAALLARDACAEEDVAELEEIARVSG